MELESFMGTGAGRGIREAWCVVFWVPKLAWTFTITILTSWFLDNNCLLKFEKYEGRIVFTLKSTRGTGWREVETPRLAALYQMPTMRIREIERCGVGPRSWGKLFDAVEWLFDQSECGKSASQSGHMDEKITRYPVHPGLNVAVADAGIGNSLPGSSKTISEDDISRNPHFLSKHSFIF